MAIQETPDVVIWAYSERTFSENKCGGRKVERGILSSFEFWDSATAVYGLFLNPAKDAVCMCRDLRVRHTVLCIINETRAFRRKSPTFLL